MNLIILESPIESLALKYFNEGGFLTAFTWAAVITAAVSFWKIKALSSPGTGKNDDVSSPELAASPAPDPIPSVSSAAVTAPECVQGYVKTKFTSYYVVDDLREGDDDYGDEEDADAGGDRSADGSGYGMEWDLTAGMRLVDMGWYQSQDLTVNNGSVVRLWDRRTAISQPPAAIHSSAAGVVLE